MNPKLKPLLIVIFVLAILVLNLTFFWKGYRTVLLTHGKKQTPGNQVDFDQLKQALDYLEKRKMPVFEAEEKTSAKTTLFESERENPPNQQTRVQILNGSGIAGAAAKLSEKLDNLEGLTIISIGNTERTSTTVLKTKKSVLATTKQQVLAIIQQDFPDVSEEELAKDSAMDIVIVLGR